MTKKDFEIIVEIIACSCLAEKPRETIAWEFAYGLAKTNPGFNQDKFIEACCLAPKRIKRK